MGNLTNDMTRLRENVESLRSSRKILIQDLKSGRRELAGNVSAMQADFARAHAEMARESKLSRSKYVSALAKSVTQMRKAYAADINGAHYAWFGKGM